MVEATEELVKIYLEQRGYLVTASKKVEARTTKYSPNAEIDLVAIHTGSNDSGLPSRIVGEVKSYGIDPRGFEELDIKLRSEFDYKSRPEYSRYKWVNNKEYRNKIIKKLNSEYGYNDFKYVLFCDNVNSTYEKRIREYLSSEDIGLVTHGEILNWLFENRTNEYTNDQILQLIRLINMHKDEINSLKPRQ